MKKNKIICAALQKYGVIIAGPRHFDSVMLSQVKTILDFMQKVGQQGSFADAEQGFVDKYGDFWNRTDALIIARANGQNIDYKRNGSKTELFSEGLY